MRFDEKRKRRTKFKDGPIQLQEPAQVDRLPRAVAVQAKEAAALKSKIVELRELARQGLITARELATLETQAERELVELRESAQPNRRAPMGTTEPTAAEAERDLAVALYESFIDAGETEAYAFNAARGRDLSVSQMRRALTEADIDISEAVRAIR